MAISDDVLFHNNSNNITHHTHPQKRGKSLSSSNPFKISQNLDSNTERERERERDFINPQSIFLITPHTHTPQQQHNIAYHHYYLTHILKKRQKIGFRPPFKICKIFKIFKNFKIDSNTQRERGRERERESRE